MGGSTDARLRVAMIAACPFPYPRGTPIRIHRLSTALADRGHEVHVFTYHLGVASSGEGIAIHRTVRVPTYNKYGPGPAVQKLLVVDPLLTLKVFSGLGKRAFDVIHAHHYEGLLVGRAAKLARRVPLVYDAHTLLGSELGSYGPGFSGSAMARVGKRLDRWLPRLADHVIAVSDVIEGKLVEYGMDAGRVTVVMNGVEHERFQSNGSTASREHGSTLIFTGNLARYQGIELLLHALATIAQKRPDVRLLLVTESPFDPYEPLARQLGVRGRVEIIPAPFEQQPALLASAAVALNPRPDCDGVPQKLLNYMAAARATVSFAGSAPCIEHGTNGWIVQRSDPHAFAAGVLTLLEDPALARRLGQEARQTVLTRYTWGIAAQKSEEVYRRLLRREHDHEPVRSGSTS